MLTWKKTPSFNNLLSLCALPPPGLCHITLGQDFDYFHDGGNKKPKKSIQSFLWVSPRHAQQIFNQGVTILSAKGGYTVKTLKILWRWSCPACWKQLKTVFCNKQDISRSFWEQLKLLGIACVLNLKKIFIIQGPEKGAQEGGLPTTHLINFAHPWKDFLNSYCRFF